MSEAQRNEAPLDRMVSGFLWKPATGPWASGDVLYVGKWPVGSAAYASSSKGDTKNYVARSRLPGLKEVLEYFETMDEAKERVERATRYWLRELSANVELRGCQPHETEKER
jgi:hypothetical protein